MILFPWRHLYREGEQWSSNQFQHSHSIAIGERPIRLHVTGKEEISHEPDICR